METENILLERHLFLKKLGFKKQLNSHLYYIPLNEDGVNLLCTKSLAVWVEYVDVHSAEENSVSVGIGTFEPENFVELVNVMAKAY